MIEGVTFVPFETRDDHRGDLTEIFRASWLPELETIQWNVVRSSPGTLRGVHCHWTHTDYLTVVDGELILGLVDVRRTSPTFGRTELHRIPALSVGVEVPVGVAHGFTFEVSTTMVYAVSHYWNLDDEYGCRWDDPELDIDWSISDPVLSDRDATAGSFAEMVESVNERLSRV